MILGKKLYLIVVKNETTQRLATKDWDKDVGTYYRDLGIVMDPHGRIEKIRNPGDMYFPEKLRQIQELVLSDHPTT